MSTEIMSIEDQLAALAKASAAAEKPPTSNISFKAGVLAYNGDPVPGNKLDCIIIASTHVNLFYAGKYDPDALASPICYAYGDKDSEMAPHESSAQPQAESCSVCPHNQFGSADNKKGKACKNSRHLALIPASTKPEDVATVEVAISKVPVTSVKAYSTYVHKIRTLYNRPPLGLITEISVTPDVKTQFKVNFVQKELVDTGIIGALIQKSGECMDLLRKEYDVDVDDADPEPAVDPAPAPAGKRSKF
jgi:hypothetical protein